MIPDSVLIDTGPMVAMLRAADRYHKECLDQLRAIRIPAYTCWPVITEVAYLSRQNPKAVRDLLSRCDGTRFEILPLGSTDLPPINEILANYEDQSFDFADVCLMHLANREGIRHVFTLDRRHFSVFRTAAGKALEVLP